MSDNKDSLFNPTDEALYISGRYVGEVSGDRTRIYMGDEIFDLTDAHALRDWLNKVIPNE
jgi:hypothetical protein